jgi:hypothetical protein
LIARLLASVAPLVKVTSSGKAPSKKAIFSRASSSACLAFRPPWCAEDGFPKLSNINGRMASQASGSSGVVAL